MLLLRFTVAVLLFSLLTGPLLAQSKGKKGQKKNVDEPVPAKPAAEPGEAEEAVEDESIPRVVPAFDPGSHTQAICAMGFSDDKKKLITVGQDASIQVWSTTTGERLDILRLPAYGHDQVSNIKAWNVAAISRDGRYVAIGGGVRRSLTEGNQSERAKLMLVDVVQRSVRQVSSPLGSVTALAFSPTNRLVAAYSGSSTDILLFPEVAGGNVRRRQATVLTAAGASPSASFLQFSPDGKQLLAGHGKRDSEIVLWEISAGQFGLKKRFKSGGETASVAWSPDLQRIAIASVPGPLQQHGFEVRSAAGELLQDFQFDKLSGLFHLRTDLRFLAFIDAQNLLMGSSDAHGFQATGTFAYRFDLAASQCQPIYDEPSPGQFHAVGAITHDHELAAMTVSMGLDAVVLRVKDGSVVARCGAASPIPTVVGWAEKDRSPGFAWSEVRRPRKFNTDPKDLQFGFDLGRMEPIAEVKPTDYGVLRESISDWNVRTVQANQFNVNRGEETIGKLQGGNGILARTLIPRGVAPPLVAWAANRERDGSATLTLSNSDGATVTRLLPEAVFVRDVAPSPDGRFVIVSTGTHRLNVYATDGQAFPFLSFARVNGEWVAWSREGYFAASPGGEKMFGWAVSNGPNSLSTFHPAEKFANHFRRPDLLQLAIELGSIEAALKRQTEARAPAVEQLLPPKGELKLVKQADGRITVRASGISSTPDKPVVAMRLLLDGRPLINGNWKKTVAKGEKAEATFEIDFPAGRHELKLLVRGEENSSVSDPLVLVGPKSASQIPVLHRLCVGVDKYALPALNLTSAAKDATDVYGRLEKYCVGEANRFGKVNGVLLTNSQATSAAVLKAIGDIRKVAKPGDLMVILFAGHGIQQAGMVKQPDGTLEPRQEYYLMTHEADPSLSLKGKSLSGTDLRQTLGAVGCPVLLVMDSCHSASSVKSFRPAIDDLTRGLTDDSTGVTILAAAMSHEVASATAENGYFTAAFLKALAVGNGVPYDPHDHVLYTHHIYSVVFSEVRNATKGKQNPFLNMPWTVPPLALREVSP